ncbi:MAG TPA: sugar ABC transporter permease [Clostridiales bacterium]|nr:sugar ABC transporter permease [Clostridiales bacterium]
MPRPDVHHQPVKRPQHSRPGSDTRAAWLLILPFMIFFSIFVLFPLLQNFWNSLTNYNLTDHDFIGLANYQRLLEDRSFLRSIVNTLIFALGSVAPAMLLGFVAALCVGGGSRALPAVRTLLMFPYIISLVSAAMVWLYLFDPGSGILNKILLSIGLPASDWLFDEHLALPCLIVMNIWKYVGYVMIIDLAALKGVPAVLHEAARVDGAGYFRRIWHITLPAIKPVSGFLLATLSVECFKTFEQVRIMTDGGPVNATTTITHQIYIRAFAEFKMGYASAMSVVLLLMVLMVTLFNLKVSGQSRDLTR